LTPKGNDDGSPLVAATRIQQFRHDFQTTLLLRIGTTPDKARQTRYGMTARTVIDPGVLLNGENLNSAKYREFPFCQKRATPTSESTVPRHRGRVEKH
jgi:hypothetical protein